MKNDNYITIYNTVWFDGPNGEERDIPVANIYTNPIRVEPILNLRGKAYAYRNDFRYRKNKKHDK
jgi:hypothetical protein